MEWDQTYWNPSWLVKKLDGWGNWKASQVVKVIGAMHDPDNLFRDSIPLWLGELNEIKNKLGMNGVYVHCSLPIILN